MVGQGVLRECLLDPDVQSVLSIGRSATGARDPKLRELVHRDFTDFSSIESQLSGFEACFFCLGVSSVGLKEGDYRRVSYDFTMAAARVLVKLNPGMTFVYVSGTGTDSSERGRTMWARVKGKTENDLFRLPFRAAYMFRPGVIVPLHGIKSRTKAVRVAYAAIGPLLPLVRAVFPKYVTTTELLGRAMINAAKHGAPTTLLENADINELGRSRVSP